MPEESSVVYIQKERVYEITCSCNANAQPDPNCPKCKGEGFYYETIDERINQLKKDLGF